jgi:hypothetical protein
MNTYNNNDLIIKELTEKIIIHKKHITTIEQDFLRMNENINYQFEKYKNTINEKIKLNNIIIDNFCKDIIYRISIIDNKIDHNKIDYHKIDNNKIDHNNNNHKIDHNNNNNHKIDNNDYKKDLMILKKDFDNYIDEINYQIIKLKHNTNDKITNLNNIIDDININCNNKIELLKNKNNIYFYWIVASYFLTFVLFQY